MLKKSSHIVDQYSTAFEDERLLVNAGFGIYRF